MEFEKTRLLSSRSAVEVKILIPGNDFPISSCIRSIPRPIIRIASLLQNEQCQFAKSLLQITQLGLLVLLYFVNFPPQLHLATLRHLLQEIAVP